MLRPHTTLSTKYFLMKKTLILAGALATAATFSAHQSYAQGVRFGIKGGANLSNLSGKLDNNDLYKNKFGFVGGLLANVSILPDNFLSIQPEVLYSQKGFKYADNTITVANQQYKYEGKSTYNYIDVPVLLKVNAGGIFFEAGPQYSYLLNVRDKTKQSLNGADFVDYKADRNLSNARRSEFGYVAGLGFQATNGFMFDVRYNGAFTDFAKDGYQNGDLRNARNQVFQATIGYMFLNK